MFGQPLETGNDSTRSRELGRLVRFLVIGTASVAIDLGVYALLSSTLGASLGKAVSYLAGMAFGFIGNKFWTFESRRRSAAEPLTYVALYAVTLPYAGGVYRLSGGRTYTAFDAAVVRLTCDDGTEGWGESTPFGSTYVAAHPAGTRAGVELLAPALLATKPAFSPIPKSTSGASRFGLSLQPSNYFSQCHCRSSSLAQQKYAQRQFCPYSHCLVIRPAYCCGACTPIEHGT